MDGPEPELSGEFEVGPALTRTSRGAKVSGRVAASSRRSGPIWGVERGRAPRRTNACPGALHIPDPLLYGAGNPGIERSAPAIPTPRKPPLRAALSARSILPGRRISNCSVARFRTWRNGQGAGADRSGGAVRLAGHAHQGFQELYPPVRHRRTHRLRYLRQGRREPVRGPCRSAPRSSAARAGRIMPPSGRRRCRSRPATTRRKEWLTALSSPGADPRISPFRRRCGRCRARPWSSPRQRAPSAATRCNSAGWPARGSSGSPAARRSPRSCATGSAPMPRSTTAPMPFADALAAACPDGVDLYFRYGRRPGGRRRVGEPRQAGGYPAGRSGRGQQQR